MTTPSEIKTGVQKSQSPNNTQRPVNSWNWILKAYLYVLIFLGGMRAIVYILYYMLKVQGHVVVKGLPVMPIGAIEIMILTSTASICFLYLILKKRRWAFFAYCLTYITYAGGVLYMGGHLLQTLIGFVTLIALFALLYVGGKESAWSRMR